MIKTQEDFFKKYLPLTLLQGFEKVVWGFTVRGSWRSNITAIFWPLTLMAVTLCLSCSLDAQPLLGDLLHLISRFSGPQTPSGFPRAPSAGCGFPSHIFLQLAWNSNSTAWLLSWLSYIIVQRPLDRPRDLWNRMFNRHQGEITAMQFRGHPLPVHQSMRV